MHTNQLNNPDWEKVIAILQLEEGRTDLGDLTEEEQVLLVELSEIKAASDNYRESPEFRTDLKWAELKSHILASKIEPVASKTINIWPRVFAIAAAIAFLVIGVYFFRNYHADQAKVGTSQFVNDVAPGKVGATLTLANGKKLVLGSVANGEIARESGIVVTKTASCQIVYEIKEDKGADQTMNTLSTAKGETYILRLPDGSKVWMNAASSLTYSARLREAGKRVVKLSGEAYFEIAKDKKHPFIVESKGQQVEVLGTHFNINAYTDEQVVKTTLLEGSVNVNGTVIKPNQQAVLTANNALLIKEVNAGNEIAWKEGLFKFEHTDIKTSMRQIARWYDVEVIYEGQLKDEQFYGKIDRSYSLSEVLLVLERSNVHFRIEGKKIIVMQ